MVFWQVFLLFSVCSAAFLLWPMFQRWKAYKKALRLDQRSDLREAVHADREQELEKTHVLGDIDESELKSLKRDLAATSVVDSTHIASHASRAITLGKHSRTLLIAVSVLLPLIAFGLYHAYGAKPDWEIRSLATSLSNDPENGIEDRKKLIAKIHNRLKSTPENGHLWYLLGSTATAVGDYEEAVRAYRELNKLFPDTPMIIGELAQALFLRAGSTMTPEVRKNTQLALSLNSELPTALGLAGIDAYQSGDYPQAIQYWQRAVRKLDPNSPSSQVLSQGIARAQIAQKATSRPTKNTQGTDVKDNLSLSVNVSLGENVEGVEGNETLYVYARAWQGPKMPLSTRKLSAGSLPTTVLLDKSTSMVEGLDITSASQLEVIARISKTGDPSPQSGDWMASYGPVILTEARQKVSLEISELVP